VTAPGAEPAPGGHPRLRAVALLAGCLALSVGSPVLLVAIPLGLFGLLLPAPSRRGVFVGAALLGWFFLLVGGSGLVAVDRGWGILLGGSFVALTLVAPERSVTNRALGALALAGAWASGVLALTRGWGVLEGAVARRIEAGTAATLSLVESLGGGEGGGAFAEAAQATGSLQLLLFPAQAAVASLLALAGAWWLHVRITEGRTDGVGPLAGFRFPDEMVWVLILGIALILGFGWEEGWGRAGANLVAFAGALFALRGAAVLLHLSGGVGWMGGLLLAVGLVLAAPVVVAGASVVGLGDAWMDFRSRASRGGGPGLQ
jgi:hypothetical protein